MQANLRNEYKKKIICNLTNYWQDKQIRMRYKRKKDSYILDFCLKKYFSSYYNKTSKRLINFLTSI